MKGELFSPAAGGRGKAQMRDVFGFVAAEAILLK
jgi:hypothetical protein